MRVPSLLNFISLLCAIGASNAAIVPPSDSVPNADFDVALDLESLQPSASTGERHIFKAEVSRLLDIIINFLYNKKEVFLRELISNAADALEKMRFLSATEPEALLTNPSMEVRVEIDAENNRIIITDTGIGMTRHDLMNSLGTIAQSGTTNFLEAISQGAADLNLIGQFGVGFYASFLVSNKVTVISKHNDDPIQHIWQSSAASEYTISEDPRGNTLNRGTKIILELREDASEFLKFDRIKDNILRYNQFVSFPIYLKHEVKTLKPKNEKSDENEKTDENEKNDENEKTDETEEDEYIVESYWERMNNQTAIWLRSKDSVSHEEYVSFYKSIAKVEEDPLAYVHFAAEGEVDFKSVLFIPGRDLEEAWSRYTQEKQHSITVYARRIMVSEAVFDFIPKWANFIRGVVDSDDLPLKVDRESVAQNRAITVIGAKVTGKLLEILKKLHKQDVKEMSAYREKKNNGEKGEDEEILVKPVTDYSKIWEKFRRHFKVGCAEDQEHRSKLVRLFRYTSSFTGPDELTTLEEYITRMKEDDKEIYYITGDNYDACMASPHIQYFLNRGHEVLVFTEPLDESCVTRVAIFDDKRFVSIEKSNARPNRTDEERLLHKKIDKIFAPLTKFLTTSLKDRARVVNVSHRLVDAPIAVVAESYGSSSFAERVIRVQSFNDAPDVDRFRRVEYNPHHTVMQKMLEMVNNNPEDPELKEIPSLLFDLALLNSGYQVDNPTPLSFKLVSLLQGSMGLTESISTFVVPDDYEINEDAAIEETRMDDIDAEIDADAFSEMIQKSPYRKTDGDEIITPEEIKAYSAKANEQMLEEVVASMKAKEERERTVSSVSSESSDGTSEGTSDDSFERINDEL